MNRHYQASISIGISRVYKLSIIFADGDCTVYVCIYSPVALSLFYNLVKARFDYRTQSLICEENKSLSKHPALDGGKHSTTGAPKHKQQDTIVKLWDSKNEKSADNFIR